MVGLASRHERAVLQAGAGGGGRQAGRAARQAVAAARALHPRAPVRALRPRALRQRHLRPYGAPPARTHRLIRYYKPGISEFMFKHHYLLIVNFEKPHLLSKLSTVLRNPPELSNIH